MQAVLRGPLANCEVRNMFRNIYVNKVEFAVKIWTVHLPENAISFQINDGCELEIEFYVTL